MSRADATLLVGIGSPFGDDRLGWLVVEEIRRRGVVDVQMRCARAPADLLDWLDGVERLIVCDACRSDEVVGLWRCIECPSSLIESLAFAGTHDLSLAATLELAESLNMLPKRTAIWCMNVPQFVLVGTSSSLDLPGLAGDEALSPEIAREFRPFVDAIERDLIHA